MSSRLTPVRQPFDLGAFLQADHTQTGKNIFDTEGHKKNETVT